ncbi:hypothetical protein EV363DRAFT_1569964 [Boletus edulis]|nr:hypothetical protein EV363DRAFT_1569964 [Boletus edulis]
MGNKTTSWPIIPKFLSKALFVLMDRPHPPPAPYVKGVFPLTRTSFQTYNSPHEWLEALVDSDVAQVNRCLVEEVTHYKCTSGKEHEFLFLQVDLTGSSTKASILVDRSVQIQDTVAKSMLSSNTTFSSTPECPAVDSMTCAYTQSAGLKDLLSYRGIKGGYKVIQKLTYDPTVTRLLVLEFASLVQVTSSHAPSYSLYQNQCFWFAATIMEALVELFPNVTRSPEPRKGGTYLSLNIPMANSVLQVFQEYPRGYDAVWTRVVERETRWQQTTQQAYQAVCDEAREQGRREGIEQGHNEERAAVEREHAVLIARQRELERRIEALEAQSRVLN